ncbi:hypothetical protein SAMN05421852_108123 [Thermoflavimicrobium dichotomicum]|uniref:Uncharacterized protein n=1 Tax=Thermoflavimicrobium dichotomicum TaxID=46223 RepID=A0A1I3QXT7_9BACL|nr:hypothetical protein SAMN05421852_108123 [Thermoflavimicrobium dichotomicum]
MKQIGGEHMDRLVHILSEDGIAQASPESSRVSVQSKSFI